MARDRILVRTGLDPAALSDLPAVTRVGSGEGRAELTSSDATTTVKALLAADSGADRLEVAPTDLETAFIELTEEAA